MIDGAVVAIREHIVTQESLPCTGCTVSVDESAQGGVVVAGLQIVEAGFLVVAVAAIAQGVEGADAVGAGVGGMPQLAPGVVVVIHHGGTGGVDDTDYITLGICDVVVGGGNAVNGVVQNIGVAVGIVEEIQGGVSVGLPQQLSAGIGVVVGHTVDGFVGSQAVDVVLIAVGLSAHGSGVQLPAIDPGHGVGSAVEVLQGIAAAVVYQGLGGGSGRGGVGDLRQQIPPLAVGVLVGILLPLAEALGAEIAKGIILVCTGAIIGIGLRQKLTLLVIGIGCGPIAGPGGGEDIAQLVVGVGEGDRRKAVGAYLGVGHLGDQTRGGSGGGACGIAVSGLADRAGLGIEAAEAVVGVGNRRGGSAGKGEGLGGKSAVTVENVVLPVAFPLQVPVLTGNASAVVILCPGSPDPDEAKASSGFVILGMRNQIETVDTE